ncbi:MAG TPA: patatin-like phospholipase family protein [Gemmatimonadales bacterium]|nr:patatin-like phospholipase family protein [Gemmatimonadales bacterium]
MTERTLTLVLSGGGLKGLAHIGVFQALEERGIRPGLVIGSSMGSLIGAAWASGLSPREMAVRALLVRRRHVFRVAHLDMALQRMLSPAVYRPEPLQGLIESLVGNRRFDDLAHPVLINTVDLHSGRQVFWGLPGRRDARVSDAVFASCALPGIFPPRIIAGRTYVDGAVAENLPVRLAEIASAEPVLAINLTEVSVSRKPEETAGFAATYIRGLEIVMQTQSQTVLDHWEGPPLLLVQPHVAHVSMFSFSQTAELIEEGRRATLEAIDALPMPLHELPDGVYPRRRVRVRVVPRKCIGCQLCALSAPDVFRMDGDKAVVIAPEREWSPLSGRYVHECPTAAIEFDEIGPA